MTTIIEIADKTTIIHISVDVVTVPVNGPVSFGELFGGFVGAGSVSGIPLDGSDAVLKDITFDH